MKKLSLIFNLLLLTLLIPSAAFAVTSVTRYVNTDCASNGDGTASTCASGPGFAGAYTTLYNAWADISVDYANFVTSDVQVTIDCRGTAADDGGGNSAVLSGVTTDATHYLSVTVAAGNRHDGKWNTGKYRLSGGHSTAPIQIRLPFVRLSWLQIENSKSGAGGGTNGGGIYVLLPAPTTTGRLELKNSIVKYTGDYTNQTAVGWDDQINETSGVTKIFINNIFYDWKQGIYARSVGANSKVYMYNNTSYSNVASSQCFVIRMYGGGTVAYVYKNNLANGSCQGYNIDSDGSTSATTANNLSEDTSSPDDTYDSQAVLFVDETGRDLHLSASDAAAKDLGADLSAATEGFATDIDNEARPDISAWDIGADEETGGVVTTTTSTTLPTPPTTVYLDDDW